MKAVNQYYRVLNRVSNVGPIFSYLFDVYAGGLAGYSLNKLRTGYTGPCLKVRRSSDNTTLDIGFSGNSLDVTSLLSFVGAGNGFVEIWYDQSGFSYDLSQNINNSQPQIVSTGNLRVDSKGNPWVYFDGVDDILFRASGIGLWDKSVILHSVVGKIPSQNNGPIFIAEASTSSNNPLMVIHASNNINQASQLIRSNTSINILQFPTDMQVHVDQEIIFNRYFKKSDSRRSCLNGALDFNVSQSLSGLVTVDRFSIGGLRRASSTSFFKASVSEILIWDSELKTNQIEISTSQNNWYQYY